jgi:transposase
MGARAPRCDAGRTRSPAPRAVWAPGKRIHDIASPHAHGTAAQKKSLHASERDTARVQQARAGYWQRIAALDPQRLRFVDESGVNLALTRLYGRAPKGERVIGAVPQNYGQNVTMLGALGGHGSQAVMTVEGATDTAVLRTYVRQVLGPTLVPGDIVVLDNLGVHKAVGIQQMLARRQARLLYLPPDSPDLSPIEPCWGKVTVSLRKAKARTRDILDAAITQALPLITPTDARRWFMPCGYALQ